MTAGTARPSLPQCLSKELTKPSTKQLVDLLVVIDDPQRPLESSKAGMYHNVNGASGNAASM